MKVHLIKKGTIEGFVVKHAASRASFNEWLSKIKYASWVAPGDIKRTFNSADLLGKGSNRVVFDIGGNNYRMICKYAFGNNEVHLFICWIGTHAQYDGLCNNDNQYTVNAY